ncbi:MAG: 4-hydroxyphenylacetate 3-hydroxylase family protein [Acidimicrobiales bacterium]
MTARTGKQYLDSLREHQPVVYLNGARVADVTEEPLFAGPIRSIMQQYDMALDPRFFDVMTSVDPSTGERFSSSFLVPTNRDELVRRRRHFKLRCDHSFGFMGRAPDFMNALLTDFSLVKSQFERGGEGYGEHLADYYRYVRDNDLFLTHTLVNPQVDRSRLSHQQDDPFIHLGRVDATREGMVVRGAKMLGTMAPLTEEIMVFPFGGIAPGDERYGLGFSLPNNTSGLRYICRETVAPGERSRFDHPLSSRFEEMDCIAVFDDVVVPWERVFIDGTEAARDVCNSLRPRDGVVAVQTSARMLSNLEFFCGLAMRLADATGVAEFLHIQEKLGEMLTELESFRAAFYGAEALAAPNPATGVWSVHQHFLVQANLRAPRIYPRLVEIVKIIAGGGFFYAPTEADLAHPELRADIDKYVRGRPGVDAAERLALFKLAWDVTGDSFGQRMEQYARFYSGDPIRNTAGYYLAYPAKDPLFETVDRALGRRDDLDIEVSPEDPRDRPGLRAPDPAQLSGTYPVSSRPRAR